MASLSYQDTIEYLYTVLPMFQRIGPAAYNRNLGNTKRLCEALGNPQQKFKSIHVAGTNGKGSSCHMLAAILQSAGYKTGLYTSPHLKEFTERIKLNGVEISQDFVVDFINRIKGAIEKFKPSFFEITVAMAFDFFAEEKVDFAVIEAGLGGRLDSTNVIDPMVSLITNIGNDHKDLLGETLELIAQEKAGIIKYNRNVVISERQPQIESIFIDKAKAENSKIIFAEEAYVLNDRTHGIGSIFEVKYGGEVVFQNLKSELGGVYQKKNIPGVLTVIDQLRKSGIKISDKSIEIGIGTTKTITGLKGRWQHLADGPLMYCDVGHNEDGIKAVLDSMKLLPFKNLHFVIGIVKDKDARAILKLLPQNAKYYFCHVKVPRALEATKLQKYAVASGLQGEVFQNVNEAIENAKEAASKQDLIFIGGSTFVVAEIDGL